MVKTEKSLLDGSAYYTIEATEPYRFYGTSNYHTHLRNLQRVFNEELAALIDSCHELTGGPICNTFEQLCIHADTLAEETARTYPQE